MNLSTPPERESRPRPGATLAKEDGDLGSILAHSPAGPQPTRRHRYAVVVHAQRRDGVLCQHILTNLPAAERRVMATRARGMAAWLELVRVVPVTAAEGLDALAGDAE